jgi:hypothetical protein
LRVATTGVRNYSGYSNPRLDALLDKARQALIVKAAKALYRQAQTIIVRARPMLFLYHAIKYAAVSNRVFGVQFHGDIMLRVKFAFLAQPADAVRRDRRRAPPPPSPRESPDARGTRGTDVRCGRPTA